MDVVPNDERALAWGTSLHAAAVVELAWDVPAHRQARIRFHLERRPGFSDRLIIFEEADDIGERGRTIGYAIASMMTAPAADPHRAPAPAARPESAQVPTAPVPRPESGVGTGASGAVTGAKTRARGAVDAVAAGALGVDGPAGGWGGSLSGRWYLSAPLAVRAGASVRSGQVAVVQATSLLFHGAAGIAWVPLPATTAVPLELGLRADLLVMREQLTHFSEDDAGPVPATRWLPGADLALEGSWLFSPNAGFLASFGTEVAFGRTDVTLHLQRVTSIPPVRLVFQAGVRATF